MKKVFLLIMILFLCSNVFAVNIGQVLTLQQLKAIDFEKEIVAKNTSVKIINKAIVWNFDYKGVIKKAPDSYLVVQKSFSTQYPVSALLVSFVKNGTTAITNLKVLIQARVSKETRKEFLQIQRYQATSLPSDEVLPFSIKDLTIT